MLVFVCTHTVTDPPLSPLSIDEDIDALFGKVWTALRTCTIMTPDQWRDKLLSAFVKDSEVFAVDDSY